MIGKLINEFDSLNDNDQTVKTFNRMFPRNIIDADSSIQVEIGEPSGGYLRKIKVNGTWQLHDFFPSPENKAPKWVQEKNKKIGLKQSKNGDGKIVYVYKEGELVATYNSVTSAAKKYDVSVRTMRRAINEGTKTKTGYTFKGVNL